MTTDPGLQEVEGHSFDAYVVSLIHDWSKTLTALGISLIPVFFILDFFMMPPELLTRFALYRVVTTTAVIAQYFVLRVTQPSRASIGHGYYFSLVVAGMIALMTTDLGGFNSTYYAGLNLVMIAANLLLPWKPQHSAINSLIIIGLYVGLNLLLPSRLPVRTVVLINNLYFLISTAIISVAINWVKQRLIRQEFLARSNLQRARDSLWGEMEVAKRIQTSLLPKLQRVRGYEVAATMLPAEEVGGDYYDIIATGAGEAWISIGDVSGHGVESGLIMMMTQTSIFTSVNSTPGLEPAKVLEMVNSVLTENISRLGTDRYMTLSVLQLGDDRFTFAGKHQDMLVHRRGGTVEVVPTTGMWMGVLPDVRGRLHDATVALEEGDVVLLFTDGVTEAVNAAGRMFGEDRLERALKAYARLAVDEIVTRIAAEIREFVVAQQDDITLVAFKRGDGKARAAHAS